MQRRRWFPAQPFRRLPHRLQPGRIQAMGCPFSPNNPNPFVQIGAGAGPQQVTLFQ